MSTMRGRYPLSILSSVALSTFALAAVPAEPVITAAPVLPRQNNDRFIGFVSFSGSWYSETCNVGLTWYQSGSYGQCCPATLASCYAPTACVSGSLIYPYSDKSSTTTIACTNNYANKAFSVCNTAFIFENMQDSSPKTDIVCGESSVNWSYYRSIPASATAISSAAPSNANQATSNPQPLGGSSKAWIAGAVVGPILGLALIGALVWFILRKRQRTKQQAGGVAIVPSDPNAPPAGVGGYTDAKPQFPPTQQPPYDPYAQQNQQGAYAAQHGMQHQYSDAPTTPAPGYASNPTSPGLPDQRGSEYYGGDVKSGYAGVPANGAAELGGGEASVANSNVQSQTMHQTAELGGGEVNSTAAGVSAPQGQGQGQGIFGASELPAGGKTT